MYFEVLPKKMKLSLLVNPSQPLKIGNIYSKYLFRNFDIE